MFSAPTSTPIFNKLALEDMTKARINDWMMQRTTILSSKRKGVRCVPLEIVDKAKIPRKVSPLVVKALLLETCSNKELLVKQFVSNWNWGYTQITIIKNIGRQLYKVWKAVIAS